MTAGTLVLLRHGRTRFNASGRLQGQIDVELDDVGRWQAEQAAKALAAAHRAHKVISSDLSRALVTARCYGDLIGVDVEPDVRLRERSFGDWEGKSVAELMAGWPADYEAWRAGSDPEGANAEHRADVAARLLAAIADAGEPMASDETLVVVSHGAACTIAVTALIGQDPVGWRGIGGLHNAHWSVLRPSGKDVAPAWRLAAHNVGPGLPLDAWNAGPDWKFGSSSA